MCAMAKDETPAKLWTPPTGVNAIMSRKRKATMRDEYGNPVAKVWVDESGRVMQRESDDRLDAQVRPETHVVKLSDLKL